MARSGDGGGPVQRTHLLFELRQRVSIDEIDLVDDDDVSERYLLAHDLVLELLSKMMCIDNRDHCLEFDRFTQVRVRKEGLQHRRRIGESRRLDDQAIKSGLRGALRA